MVKSKSESSLHRNQLGLNVQSALQFLPLWNIYYLDISWNGSQIKTLFHVAASIIYKYRLRYVSYRQTIVNTNPYFTILLEGPIKVQSQSRSHTDSHSDSASTAYNH